MKKYLFPLIIGFCSLILPFATTATEAQSPIQTESVETAISVDINTAEAEELSTLLTGVGMKKAQAIVLYREENGVFKSSDDLLNVKGIGPAILQKNENRIKY